MTYNTFGTSHSAESWRSKILREFTPQVARLTLVADPDGLLLEEGILAGIRERWFELIPFEDHIAFRYAYESRFRSRWDCGELDSLRVEGLELLKRVPRCDHLAIYWGMGMAVYPFWPGAATWTGRLLRLQGSAVAAQVQCRVCEQYGERETVS